MRPRVCLALAMGALALYATPARGALDCEASAMVRVAGGAYLPLYGDRNPVEVAPFLLDTTPVTNAAFQAFVQAQAEWRRGRAPALFASDAYLRHWLHDDAVGLGPTAPRPDAPVTHVSWFAARAYCGACAKRLPSLDEWEFTARASESAVDATPDASFRQLMLDWYAKPRPPRLPAVGSTFRNAHGVWDMHGLVWEWVEDFNSVLLTGESRADGSIDRQLYCAAAGGAANSPDDYAAFLRFAMRSSLQASYAVANLGFRCARSIP